MVALGTGARKGELLGLPWSKVDLSRRRAGLEDTKNGERRTLALAGRQRLAELAALVPEQRPLDLYAALAEVAR